MRSFLTSLIVSIVFLTGCQQSRTLSSVDVERLSNVYAELLLLNEGSGLSKDSVSRGEYTARYQEIFQKYKMTKDEYISQFETVVTSSGMFRQLCDLALLRLQRMRAMPGKTGATDPGDAGPRSVLRSNQIRMK